MDEILSENYFKQTEPLIDQMDSTTTYVTETVVDNACDKSLWGFIIFSILILLFCFAISYPEKNWYQELNNYSWSANMTIMGIILIVIVIIMAYCTYKGYNSSLTNKSMILFSFVASLLTLVLWFYVFFTAKNLENSFYMSILFLFLAFLQTYYVWKANTKAGYGMILYMLWGVFAVLVTWNISTTNTIE